MVNGYRQTKTLVITVVASFNLKFTSRILAQSLHAYHTEFKYIFYK